LFGIPIELDDLDMALGIKETMGIFQDDLWKRPGLNRRMVLRKEIDRHPADAEGRHTRILMASDSVRASFGDQPPKSPRLDDIEFVRRIHTRGSFAVSTCRGDVMASQAAELAKLSEEVSDLQERFRKTDAAYEGRRLLSQKMKMSVLGSAERRRPNSDDCKATSSSGTEAIEKFVAGWRPASPSMLSSRS
jgi:hypothetical protein